MRNLPTMLKNLTKIAAASALLLWGGFALAFEGELEGELKDAWLTGKAETVLTLNSHLNRYSIAARVESGVARLSGTVGTEIDKSLATELMKGISDIEKVQNNLEIDESLAQNYDPDQTRSRRSFARWIDDVTTTAIIRSKLVANGDVEGFGISVETREDVVTLSGEVRSEAESALAEEIARNTGDVAVIENKLLVSAVQ